MMEIVRSWLLAVTGAAVVAALADSVMPQGAVKQIGKLVAGIVLLCAVLSPFRNVDFGEQTNSIFNEVNTAASRRAAELEETQQTQLKIGIERTSAAYIVDKAREMGIICTVDVVCDTAEGGLILPTQVTVFGDLTQEAQDQLQEMVVSDFAVDRQQIYFTEEELN